MPIYLYDILFDVVANEMKCISTIGEINYGKQSSTCWFFVRAPVLLEFNFLGFYVQYCSISRLYPERYSVHKKNIYMVYCSVLFGLLLMRKRRLIWLGGVLLKRYILWFFAHKIFVWVIVDSQVQISIAQAQKNLRKHWRAFSLELEVQLMCFFFYNNVNHISWTLNSMKYRWMKIHFNFYVGYSAFGL